VNSVNSTSRTLGIAFLLLAVASLTGGLILMLALVVPGNIRVSMLNIANHTWLMRANILAETISAVGVIFLGAILFVTLRKQNEKMALVALGCFLFETALGAARIAAAFPLLRISQEYVTAGQPGYLETIGNLALGSMDFGLTLLMLPSCLGLILFYYLMYRSEIVPRLLSLWGLIAISVALIGTLFAISGYEVPFVVYLPYAPVEFVIGVWILVKGINDDSIERRT